jgi:hypothetical protein
MSVGFSELKLAVRKATKEIMLARQNRDNKAIEIEV